LEIKYNYDYSKYINYLLVVHAFSLPISKALNVTTTLLIILLWILDANFKDKFILIQKNIFTFTILIFILFSLASVLWNPGDKIEALLYIKKYYHFLIIPIILTSLKIHYIKHIISAFLLAIFISEIMSYGIFFELWTYKNISPSDPSPFMGHIDYSVYLAFSLMILLNKVLNKDTAIGLKYFYLFSFLLIIVNLFMNGGRTGQLLFILSTFLFLFLNLKNKFISILISTTLILSILVVAYQVSPNFQNRANQLKVDISKISQKDFTGSFGQRVSFWYIGSHIFLDNIILGTGINNETTNMYLYQKSLNLHTIDFSNSQLSDVHNIFIMYAMQLGILGLLLILGIFYFLLKDALVSKNRNLYMIFIFIFFGFSNASNTFHTLDSMTFFAMFTGLFTAMNRLNYKGTI